MFQQILFPTITFIIGIFVGTVIGWFSHKYFTHKQIENWERSMITVFVTIAWVISMLLDIALDTYETPVAVHGVMGMVVGYFFEGSLFNKNK